MLSSDYIIKTTLARGRESHAPFSAGAHAQARFRIPACKVDRTQVKGKASRTRDSGKSWLLGEVGDEERKRDAGAANDKSGRVCLLFKSRFERMIALV